MELCGLQYETETKIATFQGKPITVTNRIPIFTPEQRERRRREIETQLYGVVEKYANNV